MVRIHAMQLLQNHPNDDNMSFSDFAIFITASKTMLTSASTEVPHCRHHARQHRSRGRRSSCQTGRWSRSRHLDRLLQPSRHLQVCSSLIHHPDRRQRRHPIVRVAHRRWLRAHRHHPKDPDYLHDDYVTQDRRWWVLGPALLPTRLRLHPRQHLLGTADPGYRCWHQDGMCSGPGWLQLWRSVGTLHMIKFSAICCFIFGIVLNS